MTSSAMPQRPLHHLLCASPCERAPASRNEKVAQGEISVSAMGRRPFNNDAARACLQQSHTIGRRLSSQRTGSARSMPGKDTLRPIMSSASHLLLIACPCRSAATGPRARGPPSCPTYPATLVSWAAAQPDPAGALLPWNRQRQFMST